MRALSPPQREEGGAKTCVFQKQIAVTKHKLTRVYALIIALYLLALYLHFIFCAAELCFFSHFICVLGGHKSHYICCPPPHFYPPHNPFEAAEQKVTQMTPY
eukprot:GEMP01109234.1.p1 GENE.GEMP01109234.1~~GEMP01109234.1.p1  ORF type:complete len:102 (+),score=3.67 GEMP01109234.1:132-437(+)